MNPETAQELLNSAMSGVIYEYPLDDGSTFRLTNGLVFALVAAFGIQKAFELIGSIFGVWKPGTLADKAWDTLVNSPSGFSFIDRTTPEPELKEWWLERAPMGVPPPPGGFKAHGDPLVIFGFVCATQNKWGMRWPWPWLREAWIQLGWNNLFDPSLAEWWAQ